MNQYVKASVNARKSAMFDYFDIVDSEVLSKVNNFVSDLENFASKYDDVMKFESDFASSSLNQEYNNLLALVASKCKSKNVDYDAIKSSGLNDRDTIADDVGRRVKAQARQKVDDTVRGLPIVGDILEVKQYKDVFDKFTNKNN